MRERMYRAQDLLRAGRFEEALSILETIDHPKAREWEKKARERLTYNRNELASSKYGEASFRPALEQIDNRQPIQTLKGRPKHRIRNWIIAAFLGLLAGGYIGDRLFFLQYRERMEVLTELHSYCYDVYLELNNYQLLDTCWEWAGTFAPYYQDEVLACRHLSPELDAPFNECLIREEILPLGVFMP